METGLIGYMGIAFLIILILLGVPLAFAIAAVAVVGSCLVLGVQQTAVQIYQVMFQTTTDFLWTSIPMFLFMGQLVYVGNLGKDIYEGAYKWFGRVPGGLAVTNVVSCAGFAAISGISSAAISALAPISIPQMKQYGYDIKLGVGSLASASTLGILIPPSLGLVVYGIWTDTSIGKLFIAGIIPGVIMACLFSLYVVILCFWKPRFGPPGPAFPWGVRIRALKNVIAVFLIFGFLIGGLYAGLFTPTEGAAVGCSSVAVVLLFMRRLTWQRVFEASKGTARISLMIFSIAIATLVFSRFLVLTNVTESLVNLISGSGLPGWGVLGLIVILYLFLGMILDSIGMTLLTLPFVFPIIQHIGMDPILFGIIQVMLAEVGLVTPPVGLNCYVLNQLVPEVKLADIFVGVIPFISIVLLLAIFLMLCPEVALWLPKLAF